MGVTWTHWSPDSRHLITLSEFKLRFTVWSLREKAATYIKYPKHTPRGIHFSPNGAYMACGERHDAKDFVMVFCCDDWEILSHFPVDTHNFVDISFAPDNCNIALLDSKVNNYVFIYSIDGRHLFTYSSEHGATLGAKSVAWSPHNEFLVVGSHEDNVRVLNTLIRSHVCYLEHGQKIMDPDVKIYQEVEKPPQLTTTADIKSIHHEQLRYERVIVLEKVPFKVPQPPTDDTRQAIKTKRGVGTLLFSRDDSCYLATKSEGNGRVVWIWDMKKMKLDSMLVLSQSVGSMEWHPCESMLAVSSGSTHMYIWSPCGCFCVEVRGKEEMLVDHLVWNCDGKSLLVVSKLAFCMCYVES